MNFTRLPGTLFALALAATSLPALADGTLTIDGKVASTGVRTLDGSVYVKISDIAKALGLVVVKRGGGYELQKPGGANQIAGALQGKVGDTLFDGKWRFQVLGVQTPDSYTMKVPSVEPSSYPADTIDYNRTTHVLTAKSGYKLVVVRCRMANGQKTTQTFWLGRNDVNNALADGEGGSHAPVGYDLEGAPVQSSPLLPGAKAEFPILFSVPAGTQIKDLVFTLSNNDHSQKGHDVRVSLDNP